MQPGCISMTTTHSLNRHSPTIKPTNRPTVNPSRKFRLTNPFDRWYNFNWNVDFMLKVLTEVKWQKKKKTGRTLLGLRLSLICSPMWRLSYQRPSSVENNLLCSWTDAYSILSLATLQIICIMTRYTYFHRYKLSIVNSRPHSSGSIHHAFVHRPAAQWHRSTSHSENSSQYICRPLLRIHTCILRRYRKYVFGRAIQMNGINCQFAFNSFVKRV